MSHCKKLVIDTMGVLSVFASSREKEDDARPGTQTEIFTGEKQRERVEEREDCQTTGRGAGNQ